MLLTEQREAAKVRPLREGDRTSWLALWTAYHAFGPDGGAPPPDALIQKTWERFLDVNEPMQALVAELNGQLVGFAHLVFHLSTATAGTACFLQDLFVDEALHGRGIGRALMAAVYSHAEAAGAERVYWHVKASNAGARRLYDQIAAASGHVVYRRNLPH